VPQTGCRKIEAGLTVRECADHSCPTPDLPHDALQRIVGPDLVPVDVREGIVGHAPYEFGVKVSIATALRRSKGGQFALHAMALPGNPYDGHTLATVIPDMERTIGNGITRTLADAGYRGHNAPLSHRWTPPETGH
jgi:hypothetical protein